MFRRFVQEKDLFCFCLFSILCFLFSIFYGLAMELIKVLLTFFFSNLFSFFLCAQILGFFPNTKKTNTGRLCKQLYTYWISYILTASVQFKLACVVLTLFSILFVRYYPKVHTFISTPDTISLGGESDTSKKGKPSLRRIKGRIHRSKSLESVDLQDSNVS